MQPLTTTGFALQMVQLYIPASTVTCRPAVAMPGWTQVAFINMSDSSQSCPSELAEMTYNGIRVCQRRANFACDSVNFMVPETYTNVCGQIIGYQIGSDDAFCPFQQFCYYRSIGASTSSRAYIPLMMCIVMV